MPFAPPQLTGHSGAQRGESARPLAEEGRERKKGWMMKGEEREREREGGREGR